MEEVKIVRRDMGGKYVKGRDRGLQLLKSVAPFVA